MEYPSASFTSLDTVTVTFCVSPISVVGINEKPVVEVERSKWSHIDTGMSADTPAVLEVTLIVS